MSGMSVIGGMDEEKSAFLCQTRSIRISLRVCSISSGEVRGTQRFA